MLLFLLACAPDDSAQKGDPAPLLMTCDTELELPAETPGWDEVSAILGEHCTMCHQDGGIAPYALTEPEAVAAWAGAIEGAVVNRTMPPFLPSTCGDCQTWADANVLSDEEIATIAGWAEGGAPIGEDPAPVGEVKGLDAVDLSVDIGEAYTPDASLDDDYRCFVIDAPNGGFVTGFDVHPGDARVVHHVIVYDPLDIATVEAADAADSGPGYHCDGGPGVDATILAAWAPGGGAINFPEGTGIATSGNKLVIQMHYNLANGAWPDLTSVDFSTADSVSTQAGIFSLAQTDLALPPGETEIEREISAEIPADVRVWGVISHMHTRGVSTRITLDHGGEEECMLNVPRWDFGWQQFWFYEEPMSVSTGDVLTLSCTYDTTGDTETVNWGEGTDDEMCIAFAYVTL